MKKLLLCVSISVAANIYCDDLSDAIRATDVEKVRTILDSQTYSPQGRDKYLQIAQELLNLRKMQLVEGSAITKTALSPVTTCAISTGFCAISSYFFLKNLFGYSSGYDRGFHYALKEAARVFIGISGVTAIAYWYKKKIQTLEDNFNNASIIYELIYDRMNQK